MLSNIIHDNVACIERQASAGCMCIGHEIDPRSALRNENVAAMGARSVSSFAELARNSRNRG